MKKVAVAVTVFVLAFFVAYFAMGQDYLVVKNTKVKMDDSLKEHISLYQDNYKNKLYQEAYPHWKYVIENAPTFDLKPYANGNTILKKMYLKTKDKKYLNMLMELWDLRAKNYKVFTEYLQYDDLYILGRKGYDLYNYGKNDINNVEQAYKYMISSINQRGVKSEATVMDKAMVAAVDLYKAKKISKEEVVNTFIKLNTLISNIYDVEKDKKNLVKIGTLLNNVQVYFITSNAADCQTLQNIFASKYESAKNNKEELLSIVRILNRFECTDSQLYADIAESLYKLSPTSEAALSLGVRYLKAGDMGQAKQYIQEASKMETDELRKATIHYMLASIALSEKHYSTVRTEANKALAIRSDWGKPQLLIAKAYLSSASGDIVSKSKAIWAAVDKARMAKKDPETASEAQKFINSTTAYYPNCEELFFHTLKKGQSVSVGGWIGGTTTVRCK